PKAKGFAVKTPWLDVIDHGTEFGLLVGPHSDQSTEVHVFKGLVEVDVENDPSLPSKTSLELRANEAVVCNPKTKQITRVPANSELLVRDLDSIDGITDEWKTTPLSKTVEFQKGVAGYNASRATFIRNCVRGGKAPGSYSASEKSEPDNTNQNYGTEPLLLTALKTDQDGSLPEQSRALIAFDDIFGNRPDQIPPNATIVSATLWLHVAADKNSESPEQHGLYEITEDWKEGTVTWASFGGNGGQIRQQYGPTEIARFTPNRSDCFHKLDVTQSVQRWSQGEPNHGWLLINHGWDRAHFDSDDAPNTGNRPRLTVEYKLSN
ncbi:MAG: DNRLRE domain-containing protein, partial [Planctomycetia bacterium]